MAIKIMEENNMADVKEVAQEAVQEVTEMAEEQTVVESEKKVGFVKRQINKFNSLKTWQKVAVGVLAVTAIGVGVKGGKSLHKALKAGAKVNVPVDTTLDTANQLLAEAAVETAPELAETVVDAVEDVAETVAEAV